jgi:transcriptional regulator with XRE-family HTH domain
MRRDKNPQIPEEKGNYGIDICYNGKEITMINGKIIEALREYLKDHYFPPIMEFQTQIGAEEEVECCCCLEAPVFREFSLRDFSDDASDYIKTHREPEDFAHALDRLRKEKRLTPAELYKRANVDRRQYSRFMGPEGRHPSMNTAISFALALRLDRQEFDKFLKTAGYALSKSSSRDVCIMFCIEKGIYEINEVNALLFAVGIDPLTRDTP